MHRTTRATAVFVALALTVPVAPSAWAARGTIRCESRNNSRNFCRVDSVLPAVAGDGRVFLRNDLGRVVNQGGFRDGMVYWNNGRRSWLAREGPGIMLGDVDSGRHFNFRRS